MKNSLQLSLRRGGPSRRVLVPLVVVLALGTAWACGCGDSSDTQPGGNGDTSEVPFHAEVLAIPGFNYDTGLQPAGSPVQLELSVLASGKGTVDATAYASGSSQSPVLTAKQASGKVVIDGGFSLVGKLKVDISGLKYDGDVPGLTNVVIAFKGDGSFDPYLLNGTASAKADIPPTDLPPIPLPGGLPGSLKIKIDQGSTVSMEFHGVCAAIQGDQAQYTGQMTRSGTLVLKPTIELNIPIVGTKSFDIPTVTVPIAVPAQPVDLGKPTVIFGGAPAAGGEEAKVGTCEFDGGSAGGGGGGSGGGTDAGGAGQGGSSAGGTDAGGSGATGGNGGESGTGGLGGTGGVGGSGGSGGTGGSGGSGGSGGIGGSGGFGGSGATGGTGGCYAQVYASDCFATNICWWYSCGDSSIETCAPLGTPYCAVCPGDPDCGALGCEQNATLPDCNAAGGCAWYSCGMSGVGACRTTGTPMCDVCPNSIDLNQCNADPNGVCAWFTCANACLRQDASACPP